ncbi:MAG: hypothetical protein JO026_00690, partial [Patescibacteria group bacterium]|nr:hypothetical protein [Patescibacteria group bacterium]
GQGVASGNTVYPAGTAVSAGVRVMKDVPTFALDNSLGSTGLASGKLMRFSVTADSHGNGVGIANFALKIASSTGVSVTNLTIYAYQNSNYTNPVGGVQGSGDVESVDQCASNNCTSGQVIPITVTNAAGTPTPLEISPGQTVYFEVDASLSGVVSGSSVTTTLVGSSSFPSTAATATQNPLKTAGSLPNTELIWSPNTNGISALTDQDWTNGYGVPGLPSGGLIQTRSQ